MNDGPSGAPQSKLEASRDIMRDLALPPGYHLGTDPDGKFLVVKDASSEVFSIEASEEDLPLVVIDLWREYINEAPAPAVARMAQTLTALDALLNWDGELNGGPRDAPHLHAGDECAYECLLWGAGGDDNAEAQGMDNDPIMAILKARRDLFESLKGLDQAPNDPADEGGDGAEESGG